MKRILPLVLILTVLCGCARNSHVTVQPHTEPSALSERAYTAHAEDYLGLRTALMTMVEQGISEGRIRVEAYNGDVEKDITDIVYTITKQEPMGAYAVDYINYECARIVSYYEINVHVTYRRSVEEILAVEKIGSTVALENRLQQALQEGQPRLTLLLASWWEQDVTSMIEDYWRQEPANMLQKPQVTVGVYPDSGTSRILDISLGYSVSQEEFLQQKQAVEESLSGAADYIRYRQTELDKAKLLYTYLTGRFSYSAGKSPSPLYDALCAGVADAEGLSIAWKLICDRAGVSCHTVRGEKNGESYTWNIVRLDGKWYHLDLARCILTKSGLALNLDRSMTAYRWDTTQYPSCE